MDRIVVRSILEKGPSGSDLKSDGSDRVPAMPTLKCSLEINAPACEVWRVLTTSELVREWASAYAEGLSIRTTWREGSDVTWKTPTGAVKTCGKITALEPEKRLRFDYPADPLAERAMFSETFEIEAMDCRTRLRLITGPLETGAMRAMKHRADKAIEGIKSLAEESAQIHRLR